jgi:plasmid stabilization system protein ParE
MALRILWTETAVRERNAILDFFRYSQELLRHFRDSLRLAANHELLGKPTDAPGVRCLFVVDYSLFYSARSGELAVLSVWDNRRDPEDRPY